MTRRGPARVALVYGRPLGTGGVESHLLSLLRSGECSWLVYSAASASFEDRARALGAEVVFWAAAAAWDLVALARLIRLLRAGRVDVVHAHSPRATLFGGIAASLLRIPVVVTVHIPASDSVGGPAVWRRARHWLYGRVEGVLHRALADRVIYVSSRALGEALARGLADAGRTTLIENGVDVPPAPDPRVRSAVRAGLSSPPEAVVVVCVARLDPQKGIQTLLEAVHRLKAEEAKVRVWLVGDGPDRGRLEHEVERLQLRWVQFLGLRHDVPSLLAASDVFVLPSRYEGSPVALLEAMAAGLASVVTDVGDGPRLVQDGRAGRVVSRNDPVALAAVLRDLVGDADLRERLGSAARAAVAPYSVARMVERTQEVYQLVGRDQAL